MSPSCRLVSSAARSPGFSIAGPEVVRIFIAPPSWEELERRLTARNTDSPEKVQERLLRAKVELKAADQYDYFVINDNVENAVAELRAIMLAEHCRPTDRIHLLREA